MRLIAACGPWSTEQCAVRLEQERKAVLGLLKAIGQEPLRFEHHLSERRPSRGVAIEEHPRPAVTPAPHPGMS
jgi:hypothetical protein